MTLQFKVAGQHIVWVNNTEYVVADSRNYLKAVFDLPEEWTYPVTVLFKGGCKVVPCLLAKPGEAITVPAEVIKPRVMLVSCYCGDLITTDSARVEIRPSGYVDSASPSEPEAPSYYSQMVAYIGQINALIGDDAEAHDVLTKLQGVIDKAQAATTLPDQTVTGQMDALIDQYISNEDAVANEIVTGRIRNLNSAAKEVCTLAFCEFNSLESVKLPNAEVLGRSCFDKCMNLRSLYAPKCKTILPRAVAGWATGGLEKVYIPLAISLSDAAFSDQNHLRRVDLHKVERIGKNAFQATKALNIIIVRSSLPCVLTSSEVFNGESGLTKGTAYIYVPRALIDDYKTATNWTVYAAQFRAIEDYTDICAPEEWED